MARTGALHAQSYRCGSQRASCRGSGPVLLSRRGRDGLGRTILLGIGGSLLVGLITASRSGAGLGEGFNRAGCLASVLGAMALIFIGRALGVG